MFRGYNGANIKTISYKKLLESSQIAEIEEATTKISDDCVEYILRNICAGGGYSTGF